MIGFLRFVVDLFALAMVICGGGLLWLASKIGSDAMNKSMEDAYEETYWSMQRKQFTSKKRKP